jgi:tetratricopeptide (TPR) repeat protein
MDRVTRSIIAYAVVIIGGLALILWRLPLPLRWPHVVVIIACLVPGRIQGYLWRDFFRGRRAMDANQFEDALRHFRAFESALGQRPKLRDAIYLSWGIYTWNVEAMLRNNIGACELVLGRLDTAEAELERAVTLDPGYPLGYFNLAIVAQAKGQPERAGDLLREAQARGFRGGTRERVIAMAGGVIAAIEGRR